MTEEIAKEIKDLRINKKLTWRELGEAIKGKYPSLEKPDEFESGKFLCESAMNFLNEKVGDGWN